MTIYSNSQPSGVGTVERRQLDRTLASVPCPESIISYNKYMAGVDLGDQSRGYYSCRTKSRKFYKYIFWFLLDVTVTNAYILQKHYVPTTNPRSLKEFRIALGKELIDEYCTRRRRGRSGGGIRPLTLRHYPIKIRNTDGDIKRGRCSYHLNTTYTRKDNSWFCCECEVWLCHNGENDCFYDGTQTLLFSFTCMYTVLHFTYEILLKHPMINIMNMLLLNSLILYHL